jgi:deferrochelatase/peroxidase EfeB
VPNHHRRGTRRSADRSDGQAIHTITVLVPLRADADPAAVSGRIDALPDGDGSPFARSPRTHFARLVVVRPDLPELRRPAGMRRGARLLDLVTHLGRPQKRDHLWRPYLVFSAAFDAAGAPAGDRPAVEREYVTHLAQALGTRADEIWGACEGYPGIRDTAAFERFVHEHALPARYVFAPPRGDDVGGVRRALALRQQVVELAMGTAGATPADLHERFLATFPPEAGGEPSPAAVARVARAPRVADVAPLGELPRPRGGAPADEDAEWNWWVREDALRWPDLPRVPHDGREPDLADVQGLAVGYPAHDAAAFVVLRIEHRDLARRWLAGLEVTTAAQANAIIDAAKPDAVSAAAQGAGLPTVAVHVAVSHAGLAALGVPQEQLAGFDRSFRAGMATRERALVPGAGTTPWRPPFTPAPGHPDASRPGADHGVHLLVHLSALTAGDLEPKLAETIAGIKASGAFGEPWVRDAGRIKNLDVPGLPYGERTRFEHFGFADGLSQPAIRGVSRAGRAASGTGELPTGELLLGHPDVDGDTAGATAPVALRRNGTYLVLRKLEQDVPAFRALVRDAAARAAAARGAGAHGADAAELAAKLVGRRRGGTSLAFAPDAAGPQALALSFGDDQEGLRCPVGAHVRRANPRDSRPLGNAAEGDDKLEGELVRRHLMVRRGIPYGPYLPEPGTGHADGDPDDERGLLFVALVGDIGRQFEFVQSQWMSDGTALRLGTDRDVFSGAGGSGPGKFTIQGSPPVFVPTPRPVVTCRGGEYFLLPGLSALGTLTS